MGFSCWSKGRWGGTYYRSSPRVRGTGHAGVDPALQLRFIPACAGNRPRPGGARTRSPVHPRVCGEQRWPLQSTSRPIGSSPRVRGTDRAGPVYRHRRRFIPACAGNRSTTTATTTSSPVHPRVCGEQKEAIQHAVPFTGSSPRVRGTVDAAADAVKPVRFIPACAGNRRDVLSYTLNISVHPRVCGEQSRPQRSWRLCRGSSPRVRGTEPLPDSRPLFVRFIPACAGNRAACLRPCGCRTVHPRVCGEQHGRLVGASLVVGSSPRVRGTAPAASSTQEPTRFIPACAGNSG